jgi:predicted metal-dependent hydrolase
MEQQIRQLQEFADYYVTITGDVLSNKRESEPFKKLKQQKATQSKKKYYQVRLFNKTYVRGKLFYVHRLVWEGFNGPIPDDKQIDHIDGDTSNNRLDNLQLLTLRQNVKKYLNESEKSTLRRYREEFVKDYKELGTYQKVADKWGCSSSTAWYIVNNLVLTFKPDGSIEYVEYKRN